MALMKKVVVFSPHYQPCCWISLSSLCLKRKPPPVRDPSKRNFQGEKLEEYMRKRAEAIEALQPYKSAVREVVERYKMELEEKKRIRDDVNNESMQRALAERKRLLMNSNIIAKSNEDIGKQLEHAKLVKEEKNKQNEEMRREKHRRLKEETKKKNTQIVLKLIEESKDFITYDNMDEKIELALSSEVNFNYAITASGKKIHSTKPPGNLDGWKGASPSAYIAGGIDVGSSEWNSVFKDRDIGFHLKIGGLFQNINDDESKRDMQNNRTEKTATNISDEIRTEQTSTN